MLELRADVDAARARGDAIATELAAAERHVAAADAAVVSLVDHQHAQEKAIVGSEGELSRTSEDRARVGRRLDVITTERARAESEHEAAEARRHEATTAIDEHEVRQRTAEESLGSVLGRLHAARDEAEGRLRLVTAGRTGQATYIERTAAFDADVIRLEEAGRELDGRIESRHAEIRRTESRRDELAASIVETERLLDADVVVLESLKVDMRQIDERLVVLRADFPRATRRFASPGTNWTRFGRR